MLQPRATVTSALVTLTATQALAVFASFALPVLAPLAAPSFAIEARSIGAYASLVFAGAMLAALLVTGYIGRYGPIRTGQITLVFSALGLLVLLEGGLAALACSAVLIGLGYGPQNPASSFLLSRLTEPGQRGRIFSAKQVGVPAAGAAAGLTLPLLGNYLGWQTAIAIAAVLCLAVAVAIQPWRDVFDTARRPGEPLLRQNPVRPVRYIFSLPRLRALGCMGLCYSALQYTFSSVFVVFLVERAGLTPVQAGSALSAALATGVVMRIVWGAAADWLSARAVVALLGILMSGAAAVSIFASRDWPHAALIALACWFGAAGMSWPGVYLAAIADETAADHVALATSGSMFFLYAGGILGPALFTGLTLVTGNYDAGFLLLAVLTAAGAILAFAALREPPATQTGHDLGCRAD